jgi:hypothetical protein
MRTAVALLASTLILAGAAPAFAGGDDAPTPGRLLACDNLGERPTHGQIRACVEAARRFVEAHRAIIEKARIEIHAHRTDIEAAMRAGRDNAAGVREAEQALTESRNAIDEALRELRDNERTYGAPPEHAPPATDAAPPDAPAK